MSAKRFRVLIVDDEIGVRNALARLLRRHNMEVATAVNGQRALRRLRRGERFDCMIFDLLMPDMMGRDFVEAIGREEIFPLNRMIVLTAVHNVDNATAYLQYGCAGYCGKPYDNNRILQQIQRACGDESAHELDAIA